MYLGQRGPSILQIMYFDVIQNNKKVKEISRHAGSLYIAEYIYVSRS